MHVLRYLAFVSWVVGALLAAEHVLVRFFCNRPDLINFTLWSAISCLIFGSVLLVLDTLFNRGSTYKKS